MDALKRAEQAREANDPPEIGGGARARETFVGGQGKAAGRISEFSLDPLDNTGSSTRGEDNNETGGFQIDPMGYGDTGLSLEPVGEAPALVENSRSVTLGGDTGIDLFRIEDESNLDAMPGSGSTLGSDSISLELDLPEDDGLAPRPDPREASADQDLPPIFLGAELQIEDTSATLPSLKAVRQSVDSYFDGTESASLSMGAGSADSFDDINIGMASNTGSLSDSGSFAGAADDSTTSTGRRLGEELEAQRAAQNLFDAKQGQSAGRAGRLIVFVALPLVLAVAAMVGVGLWIDNASSPSVITRANIRPPGGLLGPSPPVPVQRPETQAPITAQFAQASTAGGSSEPTNAELVRRARAALAAGAAAGESESAPKAADPLTQADLSVKPLAPKVIEPPVVAAPMTPTPVPQNRLSDEEFSAAVKAAEARLADSQNVAPRARGASVPRARQPRAAQRAPVEGSLRISKATRDVAVAPQLRRGYVAFQRGNFSAARRSYNQVLRAEPANRDAWLGIAAVAVMTGSTAQAQAVYRRLLVLNPQDSVAHAALLNIAPNADATVSASDLKVLLDSEPGSAHLHFSLGNVYAQEGRWPEAQEAYFSAFRFDPANPDYAFNLAVSLEHLNQGGTALEYYRRALTLAQGREVGFTTALVASRIAAMGASN